MEWHLRALGYERREYRPLYWTGRLGAHAPLA